MTDEGSSARFVDVFRVPAFRVLYGAELQSIVGDELARVALAVLVFSRTGSASLTAFVFALTFLPAIIGGIVLAPVGDRLPRPFVMIGCDLLRAVAFAAMAVPGLPLGVLGGVLAVAVFVGPAFNASAASLLAARLDTAQFRTGSGVRMTTNQLAQVLGFAGAGALVAAVGTRETLLINALTYVISAFVVLRWLLADTARPDDALDAADDDRSTDAPDVSTYRVMREVWADSATRTLVVLTLLAGLLVVPESLAVPFAAQVGASTRQTGLLLATIPLGAALGITLLIRVVPAVYRQQVAFGLAVVAGIPLAASGVAGHLGVAAACWFLTGMASAYMVEVVVTLVSAVPDGHRARVISVVSALLLGSQGLGPIVFGAVASATSPGTAVSAAGATTAVLAAVTVAAARASSVPQRVGAHRRAG